MPAKLARPRLYDAAERERLFALLEARVERPLVWVSGPPGSGKTTLVTSYLTRTKVPTLWYRVDEDDADAASFFSYLALAARALSRKRKLALPALTPEYLLDLPGFARRYFRTLYAALPRGSALVLDAYEAISGSAIDALIAVAVTEIPPGMRIFVTSREVPPAGLTHLETKGALLSLSWDELRLSPEEARAIADGAGEQARDAEALRRQSDGWVAGFVLMLDHERRAGTTALDASAPARESLFAYFVNEMFVHADAALRAMLLNTAVMPGFTAAQAQALCAEADASMLLEHLYRRHYFLDRSVDPEPVYRYHALFQTFLLAQGQEMIDAKARRTLLEHAAGLLEAADRAEEALDLYTEAQSWLQAARVICGLAPRLLGQGRNAVLDKAICALPQSVVDASAWLRYWLGSARILFDPPAGRKLIEASYEGFAAVDDHTGCVLACAGMCESYYLEWSDLHPFYDWAEKLDEHMKQQGPFPSLAIEIRVLCALSFYFYVVSGADGRLDRWTKRAVELALHAPEPAARLAVASAVSFSLIVRGDWNTISGLIAAIGDGEIEHVPPIYSILWQQCRCWMSQQQGEAREAKMFWDRSVRIAEKHGIRVLDVPIAGIAAYTAINARDLPWMASSVERMRALLNPARVLDVANYEHAMSLMLAASGEPQRAEEYARRAMERTIACGSHYLFAQCRIGLASALMESGKFVDALDVSDAIIEYGQAVGFKTIHHAGLLLKAGALHDSNRTEEGLPMLLSALRMGRENGFRNLFPTAPESFMQRTFDLALTYDLETDYVRELIRKLQVSAPKAASERWPHPVRIRALGRFEIDVDGEPIEYRRKLPKRPLALLKFLLSRRGEARVEQAIDELWPDEEADAATNALDAALHRLRRLLGSPGTVVLQDGHMTLDRSRIWIDALAFEQALDGVDGNSGFDYAAALRLYRGHFLATDRSEAWCISMRERLRSRYIRAVVAHGAGLQEAGSLEAAADHYACALDVDDSIESFYQGLMRCQLGLNRRSEGLATYERLRKVLACGLALQPAVESQRIYQALCTS